ncbi:alpha/beta fold hydrolase [Enterococcus malodoratus]|uniref:alpha/beta fold hydrolase n=1 Tax=Enterococcus malodoratus TaxID=71451 RepID=UPI0020731566|nr:alpha/beta hydrolase [Enterococcus malodoratus]
MSFFNYQGKQLYYDIIGEGEPLFFLHGNTSSSKLFTPMLPLYADFQVILLDFLGYGQSDRLDTFPTELWKAEALQVIALLEHLQLKKVHLIGTSGGAWVALNAALLRPDLFATVTADSFDGRTLHDGFAEELTAERSAAAADPETSQFYHWCIGDDWSDVVKKDTDSMLRLITSGKSLFVDSLESLCCPLLLTGSKNDSALRSNLEEEYQAIIQEVPRAQFKLVETPGHPSIGTNAEKVAETIKQFIAENH